MCGVIASVGRGAGRRVEVALGNLLHRGLPERRRVWRQEDLALGHVRLPIVGIGEDKDQPRQVGRWVIGFVGEVFDERVKDYGCDTDLVAETWVHEGPEGFSSFDGFWSVVALDKTEKKIHLLTDYLAQKPLYVHLGDGFSSVCSEPLPIHEGKLDEIYFSAVAKWGYCPEATRTPFQDMMKVPPGTYCVLSERGIERLNRIDYLEPASVGKENLPSSLRRAIAEAARVRATSKEVPAALLLSGGLDSAIVYHLSKEYADVNTYHVENGELDKARRMSPKIQETKRSPYEGHPLESIQYMQEPVDLGSLLPQITLSRTIKANGGERVCLTGDGADELFGGYRRAKDYDSQSSDIFHELVNWHLPRLDRVMMRNQIEVRSPFLARKVIELALAVPYKERIDKKILRDIFRDILPEGVADTPKKPLKSPEVIEDRLGRTLKLIETFRLYVENY